jgi:S-adenosylmethionine uptake transporter
VSASKHPGQAIGGLTLNAALFALAAYGLFSVMDGFLKHLSLATGVMTAVFGRALISTLLNGGWWLAERRPTISGEAWRGNLLRGGCQAATVTLFAFALTRLDLLETMTISFTAPLMVPFIAAVLLKEKLRPVQAVAALIGFAGALITALGAVKGDAATVDHAGRLVGIASVSLAAVFYALAVVLLRDRATKDTPIVSGLTGAVTQAGFLAVPGIVLGIVPPVELLPSFFAMGALSVAAIWCMTMAFSTTQAQDIAPLEYTGAIWAGLVGWVAFAEVPGAITLVGCAVIIAASLLPVLIRQGRTVR